MPSALDPDKRAAILEDIHADELGCRAIARKHDVSSSTVSLIAQQEGVQDAFGRAQTKRATELRQIDLAEWRASFAQRIARRAEWLEDRMDDEQPVVVTTRDGSSVEYVELTGRDARDYMTAIGIAVDKVAVLTRDEAEGLAAVDAWMRSVVGG